MEFMGISVGILALICTAMLLFGRRGTVKILAWLGVLAVLGIGGTVGFLIWQDQRARQTVKSAIPRRLASPPPCAPLLTAWGGAVEANG